MGSESRPANGANEMIILYRNHKGHTEERRIIPTKIWFGSTEWHPDRQWMMDAFDLERRVDRSFAMRDVLDSAYSFEAFEVSVAA